MSYASRIIPTSHRSDDSERSESDSPSTSPTPAIREATTARVQPSTQPAQPDSVQERVVCAVSARNGDETCVRDPSPVPPKKELTLEEENRQLKEARLCKVCMDSEVRKLYPYYIHTYI